MAKQKMITVRAEIEFLTPKGIKWFGKDNLVEFAVPEMFGMFSDVYRDLHRSLLNHYRHLQEDAGRYPAGRLPKYRIKALWMNGRPVNIAVA